MKDCVLYTCITASETTQFFIAFCKMIVSTNKLLRHMHSYGL